MYGNGSGSFSYSPVQGWWLIMSLGSSLFQVTKARFRLHKENKRTDKNVS
ncbi:hypothetical protein QTP88_006535 [Uroleucon formosanum]